LESKGKHQGLIPEALEDAYYSLPAFITPNVFSTQDIIDLWDYIEPL
jgi:hypothetical protein